MMAVLRIVALIGLGAVAACAIAWLRTRDRIWLTRALRMLFVTLGSALLFFVVLVVERLQAG
jgi:hypothetical protein